LVARVRRFNRLISQRVGALSDRYLARDRSLGEARVLWEVGEPGCDVRSLRTSLGLDSGYLSRVLRSLEAAGLVTVVPSPADKRVRTARLTSAGLAERALLDRRSDQLAASFLEPLTDGQRDRLIAAMADVERLLAVSLVEIRPLDPAYPAAQSCLHAYFAELDQRFETGFDPGRSISAEAHELRPPAGLLLVAFQQTEPLGCGALKFHGAEPAEIKRMWVAASARGLGIGRRLLTALETRAQAAGARMVRLETNETLTEAIHLYRSAGYVEVTPFNDEPYARHWFEKHLSEPAQKRRHRHTPKKGRSVR
jgi:DNA-binding MarR family transcriptional regulator/ribosomal protein S18 acetylase RimI-like enzyme